MWPRSLPCPLRHVADRCSSGGETGSRCRNASHLSPPAQRRGCTKPQQCCMLSSHTALILSPTSLLCPPSVGETGRPYCPSQGLLVLPTGLLLPHDCVSPALCAACWLSPAAQGCSAASLSRESWGKVSAAIQRRGRCREGCPGQPQHPATRPGLGARRAGGRAGGGKASGGVPAAVTLGMLLIPLCPRVITAGTADPLPPRAQGPATISGIQLGH